MLQERVPARRSRRKTEQRLSLHPGAVEHYQDALAYEQRYSARSEDVAYYLRRVKGATSVLEYGAGAGRLTLPLARRGLTVMAVDSSSAMLSLLRKRLQALSSAERKAVSVYRGDMRTFRTARRFEVIIAAFHTLCHLYSFSDMDSFLKSVCRHLVPGGRLEFDLPLPRIDVPGYDPLSQVCITEIDAPSDVQLLTQRWFQPQEVIMFLHYAGFRSIRLGADFGGDKVERETSVFTVSARLPQ